MTVLATRGTSDQSLQWTQLKRRRRALTLALSPQTTSHPGPRRVGNTSGEIKDHLDRATPRFLRERVKSFFVPFERKPMGEQAGWVYLLFG